MWAKPSGRRSLQREFLFMPHGPARQYYFDKLRNKNLCLLKLSPKIWKSFYTEEQASAIHLKWKAVPLRSTTAEHPDKTATENLKKLVSRLQDVQILLLAEYQNNSILHNQLLNAVRDVASYCFAYHKPADTVH